MNTHSDSDSHLPFPHLPPIHRHDAIVPTAASSDSLEPRRRAVIANPRKKRSKLARIEGPSSPSRFAVSGPKHVRKVPDPAAPKITMPCSECGKKFWSWKALFGHMRCHPERQWRGINPPTNLRRPATPCPPDPDVESMTEEEYDVASCLLLLANCRPKTEEDSARDQEAAETDQSRLFGPNFHDHYDRFECSSCKKVFGSHQALGGHRASHKNVKGCFAIAKIDNNDDDYYYYDRDRNDVVSEVLAKKMATESGSSSVGGHQCGICLKIFSSGQALGGHKRCHWEKFGDDSTLSIRALSSINGGLDLNLPANLEEFDYASSSLALDLRLGL
ncbi:Zinc finger transcription factor [Parasponia andersonii]|uniref:Zinc finger transcription factor n=1 Tax=Parasponia andersonii TaxID=3476 RepID=A0A2P5A7S5_PARAD|nr:Zinc finger transcription factor [Parasponia andersonii]